MLQSDEVIHDLSLLLKILQHWTEKVRRFRAKELDRLEGVSDKKSDIFIAVARVYTREMVC